MKFLLRLMGFVPQPLTQERVERLARDWWRANIPPAHITERIAVACEPAPNGRDYWYADVWTVSKPEVHLRIWPTGAIEEFA